MIDIIKLINYIFEKKYDDFLSYLRPYLYRDLNDDDIKKTYDDIIWYYMFNDLITAKKEAIKIVKYIHKNKICINYNLK